VGVDDEGFRNGTGSDIMTYIVTLPRARVGDGSVVATLYYQAIPPYYLQQRFATAQDRDGKRLYYLTSHLNLQGTNIENWKLLVQSTSVRLSSRASNDATK
jgi:hypothetical protein